MSQFTKVLKLHKNWSLIKEWWTRLWKIDNSFIWYLCYEKKEYYIEIEKWFETWFLKQFIYNKCIIP